MKHNWQPVFPTSPVLRCTQCRKLAMYAADVYGVHQECAPPEEGWPGMRAMAEGLLGFHTAPSSERNAAIVNESEPPGSTLRPAGSAHSS